MSAAGTGSCWSERGLLFHDTGCGGAGADVLQRWQDQSSAVFCSPDNSLEILMVHLHCQYLLFSTLDWCHYGKYLVCGTYRCRVVFLAASRIIQIPTIRSTSHSMFSLYCSVSLNECHIEYDVRAITVHYGALMIRYNKVGLTMVLLHSGDGTKTV